MSGPQIRKSHFCYPPPRSLSSIFSSKSPNTTFGHFSLKISLRRMLHLIFAFGSAKRSNNRLEVVNLVWMPPEKITLPLYDGRETGCAGGTRCKLPFLRSRSTGSGFERIRFSLHKRVPQHNIIRLPYIIYLSQPE